MDLVLHGKMIQIIDFPEYEGSNVRENLADVARRDLMTTSRF